MSVLCRPYRASTDEQSFPSRKERPASAKEEAAKVTKRPSNRPVSASRNQPPSKSSSLSKIKRTPHPDSLTLARLKPKHIVMDKEQLYEETLTLKMEMNFYKEQNVRLKTKLQQAEKELEKRDEFLDDLKTSGKDRIFGSSLQNSHLINSLKHSIKELKAELKSKEEENAKLKKDMKVSRVNELEVELQAYIDECTRLRHHIEEVLSKLNEHSSSMEDIGKIEEIMRSLTSQKSTLEGTLSSTQTELKQAKDQISQMESKLKSFQPAEVQGLKAEVRKLKHQQEQQEEAARRWRLLETDYAKAQTELIELKEKLQESEEKRGKLETQIELIQIQLQDLSVKKSPLPGPIIDDSKYEISVKEEVKVETSYEEERAIIEEIEKSARNSTKAFTAKCLKAVSNATEKVKKELLKALQTEHPVPERVYSALSGAGLTTSVDEVALHLQHLSPDLLQELKTMISSPVAETSNEPSVSDHTSESADEEEEESLASPIKKKVSEKQSTQSPPSPIPRKIDKSQVDHALRVLSFRLQLHRIPKSKLGPVLFGKNFSADSPISYDQMTTVLSSPPFNISDPEECALVTVFALDTAVRGSMEGSAQNREVKMKEVVGKLYRALEDWEVFSTEDEGEFDRHISYLLSKRTQEFLDLCHKRDPAHKGEITTSELKEICSLLSFDFDDREFHYMELLFFSLNFQLDEVPYKKFVQAYASEDSQNEASQSVAESKNSGEASLDEEERGSLVRQYLERIANELITKSLDLKQVFRSKDGFLYPDRLIAGLRTLGIPDMKKEELVVFLDALQCEDLDEYGIDIKFFEEIVSSYHAQSPSQGKDKSLVELGSSGDSRSADEHSI